MKKYALFFHKVNIFNIKIINITVDKIVIFNGLFANIEFDKHISTTIKIRKNGNKSLHDIEPKIGVGFKKFDKIYSIYSDNGYVAGKILTTDILEMLIKFKEVHKIIPEITIKDNKIYIRFKKWQMFEANVFKDVLDYSTLKKYYDTIEFTLAITEKIVDNINQEEI